MVREARDSEALPTLTVDGTFDIETQDWTKFVVGGVYSRKEKFKPFDWRKEDEYVDYLLAIEGTIWSFNGGNFDVLWFIEHLRRRNVRGLKAYTAGRRVTSLEVGDLIMRDAAAISGPMNLARFSEIGKVLKSSLGLECDCGKDCGGHCRTKIGMPDTDLQKLIAYNEVDCLSLMSTLDELCSFAYRNQIALTGTIGASAYATVKHTLGVEDANWASSLGSPSVLYNAARKAYYGGRTQVFRPRADSGYRYDMNSAYPAALCMDLPAGRPVRMLGKQAARKFNAGRPGLYQATVDVPRGMFVPPLPFRLAERLAYPVGRFSGTWTHHELAHAISVGVTVEKVLDSLVWPGTAPILRPFCEHVWKLRDREGPKSGIGRWLKNLGNSLSGKLAQNPLSDTIVLGPTKIRFCPAKAWCRSPNHCDESKGCCEHTCFGTCWAHFPLDNRGYVFTQKRYRLPQCGHVHWAAYLTSHARVELHKQLIADGQGGRSTLYCDTDSVYATATRSHRISEHELGWWKFEGELSDWRALAPKLYCFIDPNGKVVAKAKGIPDAAKNWGMLSTGVLIDRGVLSLKMAAKKGGSLFENKKMIRVVNPDGIHFGDRILDENGLTQPPSAL